MSYELGVFKCEGFVVDLYCTWYRKHRICRILGLASLSSSDGERLGGEVVGGEVVGR